jgi:hypothetical protein
MMITLVGGGVGMNNLPWWLCSLQPANHPIDRHVACSRGANRGKTSDGAPKRELPEKEVEAVTGEI